MKKFFYLFLSIEFQKIEDTDQLSYKSFKYFDHMTGEELELNDLIHQLNDINVYNNEFYQRMRPCSKHPSNEEFGDCFAREAREFCDSPAGCIALARFPVQISMLIAAHWSIC